MDAKSYVGPLLVIVGVLLQFLVRARKSNNDLVFVGWAVGLCAGVYLLTNWASIQVEPWNMAAIQGIVWLLDPVEGAVMKVLGGTGLTSVLANLAVSTGKVTAENKMVPVTDSKA